MPTSNWDRIAKYYDTSFGEFGDFSHKYIIHPYILKLLGDNLTGKTIIDIGCGTGTLARLLSSKGASVYGVDNSIGMIKHAQEWNRNGSAKVNYLVGDSINLPVADNTLDIALQVMLLHSIESQSILKVVNEAYRVLKENGDFIIVVPHPCFVDNMRSIEQLEQRGYLTPQTTNFTWRQFNSTDTDNKTPLNLRPIQDYINPFIRAGFMLQSVQEAVIAEDIINTIVIDEVHTEEVIRRLQEFPNFMILHYKKWARES